MKRIAIITITLLAMVACQQSKFGQGGENAEQYVREQFSSLREDIDDVEAIGEDSLLSDIALSFEQVRFAKAGADFWEGKISRKEYEKLIDEREQLLQDVLYSWQYPMVVNDSLRRLDKFDGMWRKVYKVRITMKSGVTKETRVLMDEDGVTPRETESDFCKLLEDYQEQILHADENIKLNY